MFYQPPRALGLLMGVVLAAWAFGIAIVLLTFGWGRPFDLVTAIAYIVLNAAVVARVAAPAAGTQYLAGIEVAASGWIVAWSLFLLTYAPILVQPRVDT